MKVLFGTALVCAFMLVLQVAGQALSLQLVKYVQDVIEDQQVPGVAIAVVRSDGSQELGTWGVKSEDGDAMTPDAQFVMGSLSKTFTSAAMGILIDDYAHGRNTTPLPPGVHTLDWQTKVKDLLCEDWSLQDPWATERANIQDILNHVSGMPRHEYAYGRSVTPASITQNLRHLRPAFELRAQWTYNNQMFIVGAHIIDKLTGSFIKFVESRIFEPLNMTSSTYSRNTVLGSAQVAQTFTPFGRRIPWWFTSEAEARALAGALSVVSTAEDMGKWLSTFLNGGVDPRTNVTIIPPDAFTEIITAHTIIQGYTNEESSLSITGYGLGLLRASYDGHDIIQHDGGIPGCTTFITGVLEDGFAVVVLANADEKDDALATITLAIVESLLGMPLSTSFIPRARRRSSSTKRAILRPITIRADPPHSSVDFTGVYTSPGYSTIKLCAAHSTSRHCQGVLAPFQVIDAVASPTSNNSSTLYSAFETFWSTHARFTHSNGTQYYFDATSLFPAGYGKNTTPFETGVLPEGNGAIAQFMVDAQGKVSGFGLSGMVPDAPTDRVRAGGSIDETAEVWFEKVNFECWGHRGFGDCDRTSFWEE